MSQYDGDGEDNPCGFAEASEEYWYMQGSDCIRANVAFSLYGTLQGEEDQGCSKKTFINSFYTTGGVESFTAAIANAGFQFSNGDEGNGNDGDGITSDCEAKYQNGQGGGQ